jgi:hypothetical protein
MRVKGAFFAADEPSTAQEPPGANRAPIFVDQPSANVLIVDGEMGATGIVSECHCEDGITARIARQVAHALGHRDGAPIAAGASGNAHFRYR